MNKKADVDWKLIMEIAVGVTILLIIVGVMINRFYLKPAKAALGPVVEGAAQGAAQVSNPLTGGEADYDNDGVPDEADRCCDCKRTGREGVSLEPGDRLGCADKQEKSVCLTPCSVIV